MLSGTGRHRRPRQAPAFVVAAGVTGAGIALPLLGAGAAHAVTDETWEQAAECESGGVWTADTDNGYYGGLQLTLGMWEEYGGTEFADRPDLASRSQQITVGERVLADQRTRAFPGCGLTSGLWQEYRQEATGPGSPEAEESTPDSAGTDQEAGADEDLADAEGNGKAKDAPETEGSAGEAGRDDSFEPPADENGQFVPEEGVEAGEDGQERGGGQRATERDGAPEADERSVETPAEGGGRHRGPQDPDEVDRGGGNGEGRHADRVEGRGKNAERYEVRPGDSLSVIAEREGLAGGWPTLYAGNETVIGGNPDHIQPGQWLDLGVTPS